MKVYEPLMVEHQLITRLLNVVETESMRIKQINRVNVKFVDLVTDFFVTYLDLAHHGKEENILFKWLITKNISKEHLRMMNELLEEHRIGRKIIVELINSSDNYSKGSSNEWGSISALFDDFVDLYRKHIKKEDDDYYIECSNYFTQEEQDKIIREFWILDIRLVHDKYKNILDMMEGKEV
ncbi:Hemerythrin HHE cation binding domain protein [Candidatus Tiddalikarchaeum anstoanum]|nr:Hemerythrin HHE cation binding domain protein [Candidatus Tiddalikarchaeum anstoanum]